jgi:hypothetical protein
VGFQRHGQDIPSTGDGLHAWGRIETEGHPRARWVRPYPAWHHNRRGQGLHVAAQRRWWQLSPVRRIAHGFAAKKAGKTLSTIHTTDNYTNLSHWLLQQIGLDKKDVLFNSKTGKTRTLGFRALAHLCVIIYPKITQAISPLYDGQYHDQTREYGVFKLLLTDQN